MPSFCCVPKCNQKGYSTSSGEKVSFFNFPKEPLIRKQWIHAIRRDEGKDFVITERTKVCSLHFRSEDLRKSINGRIYIKEGGVPSKFDWSGPSPKKRKAPTERQPLPAKKKLLTEDNVSVNNEVQETIEMSASEPSTSFEEDTCKTPGLGRQMRRVILSKTVVTLYLEIKIALITCCQNFFQVFVLKERGCFSNTRWNSVCANVGANIFPRL